MKLSDQQRHWIAAIRKSGRFDRDYYRRWFGDDPEFRRNPERHYVTVGESRGYWPCPGFCPKHYLKANPDVAEAGVSPFYHFVTSGEKEGRLLRPVPLLWREVMGGGQAFPPIELPEPVSPKRRFAVVMHVFHYGLWPQFAERIHTLGNDCDLFVTVTRRSDHDCEALIESIREEFPRAFVFPQPNHGRDIFPFLRLVDAGVLTGYEAICKLHTKRSPHLETGSAWSRHLAESLLPGPESSRKLAEDFLAAEDCGIATADGQRKSGPKWWHENRGRSLYLLSRAGVPADPDQLSFPAGSMYWLKPEVLDAIGKLRLCAEDFEPEFGQGDGTTAHAVERILGYLAENAGLQVREISELDGQSPSNADRDSLEFCEPGDSELPVKEEPASGSVPDLWLPPISRHVHYEGGLDSCSLRGVVGWIREVSDREVPCRVRLRVDGTAITEGFADQYRADLGEPGESRVSCGFTLPLSDQIFDGEVHGFQIAVLGDAWHWQSLSMQARIPRKEDAGEVIEISGGEITGWCRDPFDPEFRQNVDLQIGGYFAAGTKPHPNGGSGEGPEFRLEVPSFFRDGNSHQLKVIVRGSRICLWEGSVILD